MSDLHNDMPIENATQFNFDIYAKSLERLILNPRNKTPFTIAINGKWGSGKTTLMKTLKNKLDNPKSDANNRTVKTVWFNAWKYSECDSMLAALSLEILSEIKRKNLLDNLKVRLLTSSKHVDPLYFLSDITRIITQGKGPEFDKWFSKEGIESKLPFLDIFKDYMKSIIHTFILEKEDGKCTDKEGILVIFIDDLDRCPPKNITNVLEAINLFLDIEGCFFVIGTDVNLIANAVKYQYEGITNFSGIGYIQKMFQLTFDLPMLSDKDIKMFMEDGLQIDNKIKKYMNMIVNGLESNQRDIKRFFNSMNLMRILGESLKEEKNVDYNEELLIKWCVLNFSSTEFIEEVKKDSELIIELQKIYSIKEDNDRKEYISTMKNDQIKDKCSQFIKNEKISSVLVDGETFTPKNIETCMFLCDVAPQEVPLDPIDSSEEAKKYRGKDMSGEDHNGENFSGEDFNGANLNWASLKEADFSEANLMYAFLKKADLTNAKMMGVNLTDASLFDADLSSANLKGANLKRTDLRNAQMNSAKLIDAILDEADLENACLKEADLRNTKLTNVKLREADLENACLYKTNLKELDLSTTIINKANFHKATICRSTLSSIHRNKQWESAIFDPDTLEELNRM